MKNRDSIFARIIAGMASPVSIYAGSNYPRLNGSDLERMRGDVSRVGKTFSAVIDREHGKKPQARRTK